MADAAAASKTEKDAFTDNYDSLTKVMESQLGSLAASFFTKRLISPETRDRVIADDVDPIAMSMALLKPIETGFNTGDTKPFYTALEILKDNVETKFVANKIEEEVRDQKATEKGAAIPPVVVRDSETQKAMKAELIEKFKRFRREPNHMQLNEYVAAVIPVKWRPFGRQLGLRNSDLDTIQSGNCGRPGADQLNFSEVFDKWHKTQCSPYSWYTIAQAMCSRSVDEFTNTQDLLKELTALNIQ